MLFKIRPILLHEDSTKPFKLIKKRHRGLLSRTFPKQMDFYEKRTSTIEKHAHIIQYIQTKRSCSTLQPI